ncbi:ORF 48 [Haloarcula hispanica virus SH1]|uniref:ORF 48 n=1 Tax=Haloarcula hispanica SH1 virus TaxID=326574 RepID=Q4KPD9_9VIRU|nr:ORF 48 [Haloarcula hispanica virus SH1]AAY24974.1 ORF 48 [Haloarcula hispanica virus SH1]
MSAFDTDEGGQVPDLETLEVAHVARSSETIDVYGGRKRRDGDLCHAKNTNPPAPGWLGNPFVMDGDTVAERRRVIAAFARCFLERVEEDEDFREAVERLRGKRVACWCRGVSQDRTADTWCHLDVVGAWLSNDLTPVWGYLRGDDA